MLPKKLKEEQGTIDLYFKLDSETALTRSFKDRPVAMAFNRAIEAGYTTAYVASTGNLAIAAAYFAKKYNLNGRLAKRKF